MLAHVQGEVGRVIGRNGNTMQAMVRDAMSTDVIAVPRHTSIADAEQLLFQNGVEEIFVVDHQELLCGVVPDYELLKRRLASACDSAASPGAACETVESLMSRRFLIISADSPLTVAGRYLREHVHRRLAVVENRRLIGQITRSSILSWLCTIDAPHHAHSVRRAPVSLTHRVDDGCSSPPLRGVLQSMAAASNPLTS